MQIVEVDKVPVKGINKSEERILTEEFKKANIKAARVDGVPDGQYYRNRVAQKLRNVSKDLNIKVVTRNEKIYLINLDLSNGED